MNLSRIVVAGEASVISWEEFASANAEGLSEAEARVHRQELEQRGFTCGGGGASASYVLVCLDCFRDLASVLNALEAAKCVSIENATTATARTADGALLGADEIVSIFCEVNHAGAGYTLNLKAIAAHAWSHANQAELPAVSASAPNRHR